MELKESLKNMVKKEISGEEDEVKYKGREREIIRKKGRKDQVLYKIKTGKN